MCNAWIVLLQAGQVFISSPPGGVRGIVMRMFVCLFLSTRISHKLHRRTSPIFVHVACDHGWVLLWWRCYTLCTSGYADDVMFSHNWLSGASCKSQKTYDIDSNKILLNDKDQQLHVAHRGRSLPCTIALFVLCILSVSCRYGGVGNRVFYCDRFILRDHLVWRDLWPLTFKSHRGFTRREQSLFVKRGGYFAHLTLEITDVTNNHRHGETAWNVARIMPISAERFTSESRSLSLLLKSDPSVHAAWDCGVERENGRERERERGNERGAERGNAKWWSDQVKASRAHTHTHT